MSICNGNNIFDTFIVTSSSLPSEEIKKLKEHKLPSMFLDVPEAYYDEVGGFHDSCIGWNPNGIWCGECTKKSCANCPSKDIKEEKYD